MTSAIISEWDYLPLGSARTDKIKCQYIKKFLERSRLHKTTRSNLKTILEYSQLLLKVINVLPVWTVILHSLREHWTCYSWWYRHVFWICKHNILAFVINVRLTSHWIKRTCWTSTNLIIPASGWIVSFSYALIATCGFQL